jgi:hypothetical protein
MRRERVWMCAIKGDGEETQSAGLLDLVDEALALHDGVRGRRPLGRVHGIALCIHRT